MAPSESSDGGNFVRFRAADEGRHLSRVGSFLRNARRRGDPTYMDFGLRTADGKIVMLNTIVGAVHSETIREFLQNSARRNPTNGLAMHLPKFNYATVVKVVDYMFNAHTDLNVDQIHEYLEVTAYLGVESLHKQLERKLASDAELKPGCQVDYLNMASDQRNKLSIETLDRLVYLLAQNHDALSHSDIQRLSAQSMIALVSTTAVNFHEKVDIINLALLWLRSDDEHMRYTPDVLPAIYIQRLTNAELEAFITYLQTQLIRKQTRHLVHVYSDMGHRIIVSNDPNKFVANSGVVVPTVEDPVFPSLDVTQSKRNEMSTIEVNTNYGRFDLDDQDLHEIQQLPDFERREQRRQRTPRNYDNVRRNRDGIEDDFRSQLCAKPQKRAGFGRFDPHAQDLNRSDDPPRNRRNASRDFAVKPTNYRIFSNNNKKDNSTEEEVTNEPKGRHGFAPKQNYKPYLSVNEQQQQPPMRQDFRQSGLRSTSSLSTLVGNSTVSDYDDRGGVGGRLGAIKSTSRLSSLAGCTTSERNDRGLVTSPSRNTSRATLDSEDYRIPGGPAYYNPSGRNEVKYSALTISELQRIPDCFERNTSRDFVEANNNEIKNFAAKSPRNNNKNMSSLNPIVGGRSSVAASPSKVNTDADVGGTALLNRNLRSPSEIREIKAYPSLGNVQRDHRPNGRERETFASPAQRLAAKKQEIRQSQQSDSSPISVRSTSLAPYAGGANNSTYLFPDTASRVNNKNITKPTMVNGVRPAYAPGKPLAATESPSQREGNNVNEAGPKSDSSVRSVNLAQNVNKPSLKGNSSYAFDKPL